MDRFDFWDGALLAVAAFVAVTCLVRLMASQRDRVTSELQSEVSKEQGRKEREKKRDAQSGDERAA